MSGSIISKLRNMLPTWKPFQVSEKLVDPNNTKKKRVSYQIKTNRRLRFDVEQDDLKTALMHALDEIDPRREMLLEVYREAKRDLRLLAQCQNGIDDVIQAGWGWFNDETGELNEDVTKLFQKQWFEKAMTVKLWEEFEGYKLLELGQMILTENGWEFKKVKEFPMENVLPERGLLIAHPQAANGVPYRPEDYPDDKDKQRLAEAFSEWLVECGDPESLGLFAVAAKNSIYKKWGLGDWCRSSEKWIDPFLVIRSGTDDQTENDKKAKMAGEFGNNSWAILDDQDEIDLVERKNANGYTITKDLLDYLDTENAIGINGQSATANDQAWSGSSEVQERTQIKRSRRRLRHLMYWVNETLKPKLMAVNGGDTAYKVIEGHSWKPLSLLEEDDAESTDPDQSDDPKENGNPKNKSKGKRAGGTAVGKSNGLGYHIEISNLYAFDTHGHIDHRPYNSSTLERLAEKMAEKVQAQVIKPGQVDNNLTEAQAKELLTALRGGYEKTLKSVVFASPEHRIKVQLEHNIYVMAAFKNHQNVLDIHDLLLDSEGKIKSKSQFLKDVQGVNKDYNVHWAATEWRLARGQAQMADKYLLYKDRGGSFVYQSMNDGHVRPEHEKLHGLTAPVDHPIWDQILPKNGYGCRCFFRWISKVITNISKAAEEFADNLPAIWKNNAGKSGRVFSEDHPYFEVAKKYVEKAQKLFGFKPPVNLERFNHNLALYETLKDSKDHELLSAVLDTGGFLFRHKNFDKKDYFLNKKAADRLAKNGYAVEIREHVSTEGIPNPELTISGTISDLKTPEKIGGIKSAFSNAKKQGIDTVVVKLNNGWDVEAIRKKVDDGFHFNDTIDMVYLLFKGEVIEITRMEWLDGQLYKIK